MMNNFLGLNTNLLKSKPYPHFHANFEMLLEEMGSPH